MVKMSLSDTERLKLQQEKVSLEGSIQRLKIELKEVSDQVGKVKADIARETGTLAAKRDALRAEVQQLSNALTLANDERQEALAETMALRKEAGMLRVEQEVIRKWRGACEQEVERLHVAVRSGEANMVWVKETEDRRQAMADELVQALCELDGVKAQEAGLKQKVADYQATWKTTLAEAERLEREIRAMKDQLQDRYAVVVEVEERLKKEQAVLEMDQATLEAHERSVRMREAGFYEEQERLNALQAELDARLAEIDGRAAEVKDAEGQRALYEAHLRERQKLVDEREQQVAAGRARVESGGCALAEREEKVAAQEAANDDRLMQLRESAEELFKREQTIKKREKALAE